MTFLCCCPQQLCTTSRDTHPLQVSEEPHVTWNSMELLHAASSGTCPTLSTGGVVCCLEWHEAAPSGAQFLHLEKLSAAQSSTKGTELHYWATSSFPPYLKRNFSQPKRQSTSKVRRKRKLPQCALIMTACVNSCVGLICLEE